MKKKLIICILSICFIIPAIFCLSACNSSRDIEFKVEDGYIQYYDGNSWNNLIAVEELKGEKGVGVDGREVEFRKTSTHIQWRYKTNDNSEAWKNLVALEDLKGDDLTAEECTITFDLNFPYHYELGSLINSGKLTFETNNIKLQTKTFDDSKKILELIYSSKMNKGDYFELIDINSYGLQDYFLGWYADDIQFDKYRVVADDLTLTAKWKEDFKDIYVSTDSCYNFTINDETNKTITITNQIQSNGYHDGILPTYILSNNYLYKPTDVLLNFVENSEIQHSGEPYLYLPKFCNSEVWRKFINIYPFVNYTNADLASTPTHYLKSEFVKVNNGYIYDNYYILGKSLYNCSWTIYELDNETQTAKLISLYGRDNSVGASTFNFANTISYELDGKIYEYTVTSIEKYSIHLGYWSKTAISQGYALNFIIDNNIETISNCLFEYWNMTDKIYLNVFYKGTKEEYDQKFKDGELSDTIAINSNFDYKEYFYVENESDVPNDNGNYWHYDTDGVTPITW